MTTPSQPVLQDNEEAARLLLSEPGMSSIAGAMALAVLNGAIPTQPPSPDGHVE